MANTSNNLNLRIFSLLLSCKQYYTEGLYVLKGFAGIY